MSILCKICTPYIRVNFNIIVCISTIDLSCTQGQVLQLQFSSGHHSVVCAQLKNKNGGHGVSHLYGVVFMSKLVNVNAPDFEPMPTDISNVFPLIAVRLTSAVLNLCQLCSARTSLSARGATRAARRARANTPVARNMRYMQHYSNEISLCMHAVQCTRFPISALSPVVGSAHVEQLL